jgi:SAM-dependent methyltransferase
MQEQFAQKYSNLEQWHWWFRGRQRILETILHKELMEQTSLAIASVGCGPATGFTWLQNLAGPQGLVVGVDKEPLYANAAGFGLAYVVGKLEEVPLAAGSFDVILALDVLEHLDDDIAGLLKATRLLRSGGLLVVTVPALPSLWGAQDVISHHRRRYTKRALYHTFAQAQLPRPRVTYFNTFLFPAVASVRWMRRILGTGDCARSDFDDNRPGIMNDILATVFSAERHFLHWVRMPIGISLLATIRLSYDTLANCGKCEK